MGYSLRNYLVEGNTIKRLPNKKLDRIISRKEPLVEYCGKAAKYVQVVLEQNDRILERIVSMGGYILYFDEEGYLDKERWNEEMRLAMENAGGLLAFLEPRDNVIRASHKFAEKRYRNEFTWKPDSDTVNKIMDMIWKL